MNFPFYSILEQEAVVAVGNETTSVTLLIRLHSRYHQVLADVVPGGTEVEHLVLDVCEVIVIRVLLRRCGREEIPDCRGYDWTRRNLHVFSLNSYFSL